MAQFICIHGHFYQPPRENPWIEEVEVEDSAYPYHDWNSRITAECYAPNAASRILDSGRNIIDIVNNYQSISFNFGPTLLAWLEKNRPEVYQAIIDADRESARQFSGHGAAIAQAYNHIILPLATTRDKRTQIIWGIMDFVTRFRRRPEGMWLPEMAVDNETLDILAEQGILFTILSPSQALRVRGPADPSWREVTKETLDGSRPYLCRLREGRSIAIFFMDERIGQELAFGRLLENGGEFAGRMLSTAGSAPEPAGIISAVSDGETYGHHHRFADMALAYALYSIRQGKTADVTIFGEYLSSHPPDHEVEIRQNTSWSCPHGVERWRENCGCRTAGTAIRYEDSRQRTGRGEPADSGKMPAATAGPSSSQQWRRPLREAMDRLRDELIPLYEARIGGFIRDPWKARDDYIRLILDRSPEVRKSFFSDHARRNLSGEEESQVLRLLEMQRHALLMYTSCGWFFDDISGLESVQVMQYACRAMQLAKEVCGIDLQPLFISYLNEARSNNERHGDGGAIYRNYVERSMIDLNRIVFNYALSRLLEDDRTAIPIHHYAKMTEFFEKSGTGKRRMICGKLMLRSDITGVEDTVEYTVIHMGSYEFIGGIRDFSSEENFQKTMTGFQSALDKDDSRNLMIAMEKEYGSSVYSLWHLFRDAQRQTLFRLLESTLEEQEDFIRQTIYRQQIALIHAMREMRIPVPQLFEEPVSYILNQDLKAALSETFIDRRKVQHLVSELVLGEFAVDRNTLNFSVSNLVALLTRHLAEAPGDPGAIEEIIDLFRILTPLSLTYDLWESQNNYFYCGRKQLSSMQSRAGQGDMVAARWIERFRELGTWLGVKCAA